MSKPVARLPLAAQLPSPAVVIFDVMSDAEEDERERSCAGDDGNGAQAHCVEDTMAAKMDAEVGLSTAALRDLLTIRHAAICGHRRGGGAWRGVEEEEGEEVVEEEEEEEGRRSSKNGKRGRGRRSPAAG